MGASGEAAKKIIAELEAKLKAAGVTAKLIYSGGVDLDILPEGASKGKGLEFLLRQVWAQLPQWELSPTIVPCAARPNIFLAKEEMPLHCGDATAP